MAIQYAPLFALETQFQAKDGRNNTGGWLKVFLAATDDPAITYSDYNYTRNPEKIILDDDGRATVICDKSKAYRLEVYDISGMLLWTEEPVYCSGTGGGGISITKVISTDGSIAIDESVVGSTTTYDIGLAPRDSDEFLEWIKCSGEGCGATWYPEYQSGTMETEAGQGIEVHKGQLYHFTNSFFVDPDGTGINYDTFKVLMYCGDTVVDSRDFDIDSSLNDVVQCEFSTDVIPEEDSFVHFELTIPSTCGVSAEVQAHRIYSGINAVPGTCATKPWVQETFDFNMSSKVDYSAIEYNQYNEITGISGSSIAGGINSAVVSSIASSYAESAASSKQDISGMSAWIPWSSSGVFQPSGSYQTAGDYAYNSSLSSKVDQSAFDDCCSSVNSALDDKFDKSASGMLQPSGDYAFNSSLSAYYPASASGAFQPSGNYQTAGDYAYNSAVSAKLDASASGSFVLNSAFSSWSSDVDSSLSSFSSSITSINSSITNIENNITSMSSDMSAYVPFSGLEGDGMKITGISGSAIKGHEYQGINPVIVDNVNDTIAVDHRTLCVDSTMTAYNSGSSAVIGVNQNVLDLKADASALSSYQPTSAMSAYATESWASAEISAKLDVTASSLFITSLPADLATTGDVASAVSGKLDQSASGEFYPMSGNPSGFLTAHQSLAGLATEEYVDSAVSGKLDSTAYDSAQFILTSQSGMFQPSGNYQPSGDYLSATESSNYYSTSNPSGFITGVDLSPYQLTADMSSYQLSGDYLSATESSNYYSTSNPSGFITGVDLTPYQLTADMSAYQPSGDYLSATESSNYYSTSNPSGFITGVDLSNYATTGYVESSVSGKFDASASGEFYPSGNPSGFITGVDLTPYQTTEGMTAYQEVSGMTAYQPAGDYQPSGDYIYVSALGWAEV